METQEVEQGETEVAKLFSTRQVEVSGVPSDCMIDIKVAKGDGNRIVAVQFEPVLPDGSRGKVTRPYKMTGKGTLEMSWKKLMEVQGGNGRTKKIRPS